MPLPFIVAGTLAAKVVIGVAATTGAVGAATGVKGAIDSKEANKIQGNAQTLLSRAKEDLELTKNKTSQRIIRLGKTKLKASSNEINDFVNVFSKIRNVDLKDSIGLEELKKLNIKEGTLQDMKDTAIGAIDILGGGIAGVGAGVLLGWGTYGGVMALGTASTGAAIGGLYGIAASNATLAWLGGGAIAAGGGGMALGSVVLGGIIAGPALLVAGGIFGAKSKEKLNNAYSNLAEAEKIKEELITARIELEFIGKKAEQIDRVLKKLVKQFRYTIERLKELTEKEIDWKKYSNQERELVSIAVIYAQIVKGIIDIPLLAEDGLLTFEANAMIDDKEIQNFANMDLEEQSIISSIGVKNKTESTEKEERKEITISSIFKVEKGKKAIFKNKIIRINHTIECLGSLEFENCIIYYNELKSKPKIILDKSSKLKMINTVIICKGIRENALIFGAEGGDVFIENCIFKDCNSLFFILGEGKSEFIIKDSKIINPSLNFFNLESKKMEMSNCNIEFTENVDRKHSIFSLYLMNEGIVPEAMIKDCIIESKIEKESEKYNFNNIENGFDKKTTFNAMKNVFDIENAIYQNSRFENLDNCIANAREISGTEFIDCDYAFKLSGNKNSTLNIIDCKFENYKDFI